MTLRKRKHDEPGACRHCGAKDVPMVPKPNGTPSTVCVSCRRGQMQASSRSSPRHFVGMSVPKIRAAPVARMSAEQRAEAIARAHQRASYGGSLVEALRNEGVI